MLDHGELNIPGRTRNINRELDAYKAQQKREASAQHKQSREVLAANRADAKHLLADGWLDRLAEKYAVAAGSKAKARKKLQQMAYWQPNLILDAIRRATQG